MPEPIGTIKLLLCQSGNHLQPIGTIKPFLGYHQWPNGPRIPNKQIVSLSSSDFGAVVVSPSQLSFTSANHLSPQTLTLRALQDLDAGDESVSISLASANMNTANVAVDVNDDETQAIIASETSITSNEATSTNFIMATSQ
jgi:hypothetical protein